MRKVIAMPDDVGGVGRPRAKGGRLWAGIVGALGLIIAAGGGWIGFQGSVPSVTGPARAESGPARILSVNVTSDEILLALAPERVIGLSVLADDPDSSNVVQDAKAVSVRMSGYIERIVLLAPDLLVIGAHSADLARQAEGLDMQVFRIQGFESFAWIRSLIRTLGVTVGVPERAEQVVGEMTARIEAVRARVAGRPRPRVVLYAESGWVGGSRTTLDDVIRAAGGVNVAADLGISGWGKVSQEQIILVDPEIILLRDARRWNSGVRQSLLDNPAFQRVAALRNQRVYEVPSRLLVTSSHHIAETVEAVAGLLHPDAFAGETE
jgi:iron complex transport system substrate-binding protein